MNAIGKSIRTGRYTDSFTQPVCAGTERQNALPWAASVEYICLTWADVIFCAACVLQILSYFGLFDISMYHLIVSVAPW